MRKPAKRGFSAVADAPPMVWLHGWGQSGAAMARLAGLFPAASHLIPDLPGFGAEPMLAEGAGTQDYADWLAARLGESPAVIVGHSFGGRVAIRLAVRHPARVRALVLIAGAGLKRTRSPAFRLRAAALRAALRAARAVDRLAGSTLLEAYRARFGSADYRHAGPLRATFVRTVNEDLSEAARRVGAPVLLIYGAEDGETPPEIGRRFAALMSDAEFHVADGFGHLDILGRGAFRCQTLIERFLARIGG